MKLKLNFWLTFRLAASGLGAAVYLHSQRFLSLGGSARGRSGAGAARSGAAPPISCAATLMIAKSVRVFSRSGRLVAVRMFPRSSHVLVARRGRRAGAGRRLAPRGRAGHAMDAYMSPKHHVAPVERAPRAAVRVCWSCRSGSPSPPRAPRRRRSPARRRGEKTRSTSTSPNPARPELLCMFFLHNYDHIDLPSGLAPSPERVGASSIKVEIKSKEMQKHLEWARAGDVEVERGVRGDDEGGGCTAVANEAQMSTRARVSRSRRSAARPQTHGV